MSFNATGGFKRSLSLGNQAEALLQATLKEAGIDSTINSDRRKLKDYDVIATLTDDSTVSFEVKFDMYAAKSGNIAIEFFNSKSSTPSGLTATKADLWCHVITNPMSVWVASVVRLKKFCEEVKPLRTITSGGDNNSCMYLYKQDLICSEVFTRIDDCNNPETLMNLIKSMKGEA